MLDKGFNILIDGGFAVHGGAVLIVRGAVLIVRGVGMDRAWMWWSVVCHGIGAFGSVFIPEHDAGRGPVPFGDDEDLLSVRQPVAAEYPVAVNQGILVGLLVLFAELAPIAAMVTEQIACQIDSERDGPGSGDGFPQLEAGFHELIGHGCSVVGDFHVGIRFCGLALETLNKS